MILASRQSRSNSVQAMRVARDWSQAELAKRSGISRAAVSAIEGDRLTPSVSTALSLAGVLGCTVEELFGRNAKPAPGGPTWAWQPWQEPCRYWEAEVSGRRLFYPVEATSLNPLPPDGIWKNGVSHDSQSASAEMTLTVATCDPAAGLLAHEYARESGFRMLVFPRGGGAALELAKQRGIHMAAVHRSTGKSPDRNAASARDTLGANSRLLRVAAWESGIALPSDSRVSSVKSLSKQATRWAAREPGSAARECLDHLLEGKKPQGREVEGHHGVAGAVRAGWADAGICVKLPAVEARLNFLPIQNEALDFCFHASLENDPRVQALIRVLRSRRYRQMIDELPGYDARLTGELASV
ncbi:helix-turn-helix domain-containing protein [Luteolibacter yonseiensis]|uniref:Helix-turn-helix domain-containing protein n=2 Tax=Luteolibacter yonseiensis TaxID=1144680 RepID=A0A934VE32_9BACT|nr:substrate-binding domain-containing protein [Luteolibacter yonseiensis]MBK1818199.1 helix-turn-helix domain-containing protein [Luteolibacter yonseiensis]